jgi:hypothetical protein
MTIVNVNKITLRSFHTKYVVLDDFSTCGPFLWEKNIVPKLHFDLHDGLGLRVSEGQYNLKRPNEHTW